MASGCTLPRRLVPHDLELGGRRLGPFVVDGGDAAALILEVRDQAVDLHRRGRAVAGRGLVVADAERAPLVAPLDVGGNLELGVGRHLGLARLEDEPDGLGRPLSVVGGDPLPTRGLEGQMHDVGQLDLPQRGDEQAQGALLGHPRVEDQLVVRREARVLVDPAPEDVDLQEVVPPAVQCRKPPGHARGVGAQGRDLGSHGRSFGLCAR